MYPTERLYLKTAAEVQVEEILDYLNENKKHLEPFEPIRKDVFFTFREQSIQLSYDLKYLRDMTGLKLFLTKKTNTEIIGILTFSQIVMGPFKSCYIGYSLDHRYLRQGYMIEAVRKGIEIVFDDYGLHRIEGNVMPKNIASINLLKKLNFKEEGLARKYLQINGVWEDHLHYTLLNE